MSSLRALIVDDEPLAAERLVHLCARIGGIEVVGVAGDGLTALSMAEDLGPDVLLLDISMPGLDGVALARQIASREGRPAVVFVTAHSRFAVEAFALAATDYLLKPVSLARLEQALARVSAGRGSAARPAEPAPDRPFLNEIWAPRGREMTRVAIEALDLVEAERDYVRLHAGGTSYLIRMALRNLEGRLDPDRFVRIHRSALVATDRITALRADAADGWTVSLSSGHRVRVGRSFRSVVRKVAAGLSPDGRRAGRDGA